MKIKGPLTSVAVQQDEQFKKKHLFLQLLSKLLGFALLVIVHDHHGSIDLTYGHVTGCKGEGRKQ